MHEIDTAAEVYLETFQTYMLSFSATEILFDIVIKMKLEHFIA